MGTGASPSTRRRNARPAGCRHACPARASPFVRWRRLGRDLHVERRAFRPQYRRPRVPRQCGVARLSSPRGGSTRWRSCPIRSATKWPMTRRNRTAHRIRWRFTRWSGSAWEPTDYAIQAGGEQVRLRGVPCAVLNETNSCPITERTHIVHYKGGWQPILLDGRRFTKHRRREACEEMYGVYLSTFRAGLERVRVATGIGWTADDFHIAVPRYVDSAGSLTRRILYIGHLVRDYVRTFQELAAGAARVAARRLPLCRS